MMYMYTSTVVLTNSSVMNIVGVAATEEVGMSLNSRIMNTYRTGNIDAFTELLKRVGVNVYLNEAPYKMADISELREEVFKKELDKFINEKGGKFVVGSNAVLPIQLSKATI